jgi:hypothetical protein
MPMFRMLTLVMCLIGVCALGACSSQPAQQQESEPAADTPAAAASPSTPAASTPPPSSGPMQIDGARTMTEALLGTPNSDGSMVEVKAATAPAGSVFLVVRYHGSGLAADAQPALAGAGGVSHPLRQVMPMSDTAPEFMAIFEVPNNASTFVLTHGGQSVPIDLASNSVKP